MPLSPEGRCRRDVFVRRARGVSVNASSKKPAGVVVAGIIVLEVVEQVVEQVVEMIEVVVLRHELDHRLVGGDELLSLVDDHVDRLRGVVE